jgi:hypothetical protein
VDACLCACASSNTSISVRLAERTFAINCLCMRSIYNDDNSNSDTASDDSNGQRGINNDNTSNYSNDDV